MKCNKDILNRVKRLQGQLNGVLAMMEDERDCKEILTQLSAVRSSIERVITLTATENLLSTIQEQNNVTIEGAQEAIDLLVKVK
ncbi:MAG: metal-sensing transcriptional repressor [Erysipelothrix sp.]|nr:metal-sensing transcriptional repressor [Erysipelothrix sp.]